MFLISHASFTVHLLDEGRDFPLHVFFHRAKGQSINTLAVNNKKKSGYSNHFVFLAFDESGILLLSASFSFMLLILWLSVPFAIFD